MCHTDNKLAFPRRSEMLAAKQASHDASNHLLAQPALAMEEKTGALTSERYAWENNKDFVPIKYADLPANAKVIASHTRFKGKDCGRVEARTVPWSHHDTAKHKLQADSRCLNLKKSRLVLSFATEQRWHIARMYVAAVFL